MSPYPEIDRDFGNWLAGFADGEACFAVAKQVRTGTPIFYMTLLLRADDAGILYEIVKLTGTGKVKLRRAYGYDGSVNRKPQAFWRACSRSDCLRLVEIFDEHPLRAKKARDYAIWRQGVLECARVAAPGTWVPGKDWSHAWELGHSLRAVRRWDNRENVLVTPSRAFDPQLSLLSFNSTLHASTVSDITCP